MTDYYKGTSCGYCSKPINENTAILCKAYGKTTLVHDGPATPDGHRELITEGNCNLQFSMAQRNPVMKSRVELTDRL